MRHVRWPSLVLLQAPSVLSLCLSETPQTSGSGRVSLLLRHGPVSLSSLLLRRGPVLFSHLQRKCESWVASLLPLVAGTCISYQPWAARAPRPGTLITLLGGWSHRPAGCTCGLLGHSVRVSASGRFPRVPWGTGQDCRGCSSFPDKIVPF